MICGRGHKKKTKYPYPREYNNNNALFALTTKGHIYIASDKNYSNLRNTYALSRARRIKEPCGFRAKKNKIKGCKEKNIVNKVQTHGDRRSRE